jgi:hypothetical protein
MTDIDYRDGVPEATRLAALAGSVDHAIAEVRTLDETARGKAFALESAIEAFHRVGLTTIVRRLKDDPRGRELLFELTRDPAVYALFTLHGIVRSPPVEAPVELVQIQLPVVAAARPADGGG